MTLLSNKKEDSWLICLQTTYNSVKYHTSDNVVKYPTYNDFLQLMMDYRIKDPGNFKKYLDSFKIIFVDLNTMDWELIKVERREKDASFEELVSLNENIEKENEFKLLVNKGKRFLFKKQNKDYLK